MRAAVLILFLASSLAFGGCLMRQRTGKDGKGPEISMDNSEISVSIHADEAELLSGERSWFNKEEEQAIQQHNALFYKHIPEEEVFRLCFRFATQEDHPQEVLTLSATQLFERMKSAHPSVMRGMTAYSLSRILPQLGERVHTAKGNVYRVVAC